MTNIENFVGELVRFHADCRVTRKSLFKVYQVWSILNRERAESYNTFVEDVLDELMDMGAPQPTGNLFLHADGKKRVCFANITIDTDKEYLLEALDQLKDTPYGYTPEEKNLLTRKAHREQAATIYDRFLTDLDSGKLYLYSKEEGADIYRHIEVYMNKVECITDDRIISRVKNMHRKRGGV